MGRIQEWAAGVRRETWARWAIAVGGVLVVWIVTLIWGPNPPVVERQLEETYDVSDVVWQPSWRWQRDTLVVDGRDISDDCIVTGAWWSSHDAKIECSRDVGIGEVAQD